MVYVVTLYRWLTCHETFNHCYGSNRILCFYLESDSLSCDIIYYFNNYLFILAMDENRKIESRRRKILDNAEARLRFIKEGIPWRPTGRSF